MSAAVRFILGRAGSGKTFHCLEEIRRRLRENPVEGPRLVFLVPEQASQQMERALLIGGGAAIEASHRAEVLSFQRLALRILESGGGSTPPALSEAARIMVFRHLLDEHAGRLRYFKRPDRFTGVAAKLCATVAELLQEGIPPESLGGSPSSNETATPAWVAKLADVSLMYASYLRFLERGLSDSSCHLSAARAALPGCDWLNGVEVWVDGFASMGGEELRTLLELAKKSIRMEITALVDPAMSKPRSDLAGIPDLFSKTRRTLDELEVEFSRAGLAVEAPLRLDAATLPRFRGQPAIGRLERNWGATASDRDEAPMRLELVELPSRRVEADYAVSRIWHWAAQDGLRFRDMAIIARDLEPYHELIAAALASRDIPFFMDRRRPATNHPLVELIRAGVAVAVEDFSLESVRSLLKGGLFPVEDDAADELENFILAHGLAGSAVWSGEDWTFRRRDEITSAKAELRPFEIEQLRRVNDTRRAVYQALSEWRRIASAGRPRNGPEWIQTLTDWLKAIGAAERLGEWNQRATQEGRFDEAEENRQVWSEVFSLFDDLALAFADTSLTLDAFAGVLEAGLAGLTLGLVPPTLDQLLVGAIERSRHPDIKAAVVIGFNDGLFPARPVEDAVLNDEDRVRLRDAGLRLAPPSKEAVLDESMLAYIALTRAADRLVVTYAASDEKGKALIPSPYVKTLQAAHPGLAVTRIADPARTRETWDVLSARDLRLRLAGEFRERSALGEDDPLIRGRWNELYDSVRSDFSSQRPLRRAMEGLVPPIAAKVDPAAVRRRFKDPLGTSVSQLESLAACPFQHFARYTLRVKPRAEVAVQAVDIGQVHHAMLEDFVSLMASEGKRWSDLAGDGDVLARLGSSCDRVSAKLPSGGVLADARNAAILRRSGAELARVLSAQQKFWKAASSSPRGVEVPFGMEGDHALPALELTTPKGRRIRLRGKIDRLDLIETSDETLGVVLDYKKAKEKKFDLLRLHHGLSLQLLAYWLVLAEHGGKLREGGVAPVAALYVPMGLDYKTVDHPSEIGDEPFDAHDGSRWRGVIHEDALDALEPDAQSKWSPTLSVYRGLKGLGYRDKNDALSHDAVGTLLALVRERIGELADALLDGDARVHPFRLGQDSACRWCGMEPACRIDRGLTPIHRLPSRSRAEILGVGAAPDAET